ECLSVPLRSTGIESAELGYSQMPATGTRLLVSILQHRQDVTRRIFEPRDHWAFVSVNAFLIGLDFAFVFLEAHAQIVQFVNGRFDIVHDEVENRKTRRGVIWFGIDKHTLATQVHI